MEMQEPKRSPFLKRQRCSSLESAATCDKEVAFGAELLFSLKKGRTVAEQVGSTSSGCSSDNREEALSASSCDSVVCSHPEPTAIASKQPCPTSPKAGHSNPTATTRSYVWRGPSRKLPVPPPPAAPAAACCGSSSEQDADEEGEASDRDKDWAALTTWLRMNLHHPRTVKRQVLFVGRQGPDDRSWHFLLNPNLTWDDVSIETKLRLRTLAQETEVAFSRKYPNKPPGDWVRKTQKYRPPGSASTHLVPLADMIHSLSAIYFTFEQR